MSIFAPLFRARLAIDGRFHPGAELLLRQKHLGLLKIKLSLLFIKNVGQPVVIGGSMGTGSYILAGNSSDLNHAFASACHGAGRQLSRSQALKRWRGKALINELQQQGIYIRSLSMRGIAEEAPGAYKDIHLVAEVTESAGLARLVALLRPLACVKG